jgi:hypothetical protein
MQKRDNLLKRWRSAMNAEFRGWLDSFALFMAIMLVVVSIGSFIDWKNNRHREFDKDAWWNLKIFRKM